MFTIRNAGGIALLLFGSTFVWLTPDFAAAGVDTGGIWWTVTRLLALATVAGFAVATWGLFRRSTWWERVALGSAGGGALVLVPYLVATRSAGDPGAAVNVAVHVLGDAGVFLLLLVPPLESWVRQHVVGGS